MRHGKGVVERGGNQDRTLPLPRNADIHLQRRAFPHLANSAHADRNRRAPPGISSVTSCLSNGCSTSGLFCRRTPRHSRETVRRLPCVHAVVCGTRSPLRSTDVHSARRRGHVSGPTLGVVTVPTPPPAAARLAPAPWSRAGIGWWRCSVAEAWARRIGRRPHARSTGRAEDPAGGSLPGGDQGNKRLKFPPKICSFTPAPTPSESSAADC